MLMTTILRMFLLMVGVLAALPARAELGNDNPSQRRQTGLPGDPQTQRYYQNPQAAPPSYRQQYLPQYRAQPQYQPPVYQQPRYQQPQYEQYGRPNYRPDQYPQPSYGYRRQQYYQPRYYYDDEE
jgi:hypothetical protein